MLENAVKECGLTSNKVIEENEKLAAKQKEADKKANNFFEESDESEDSEENEAEMHGRKSVVTNNG